MREIKFRAWDKKSKQMFKVLCLPLSALAERDNGIMLYGLKGADYFYDKNTTNHELMQYTGLKDKNGKEIYEGDIINIFLRNKNPEEERYVKAEIKYLYGGFWFLSNYHTDCNWHFYNQIEREVIGNIYENPELLK